MESRRLPSAIKTNKITRINAHLSTLQYTHQKNGLADWIRKQALRVREMVQWATPCSE